MGCNVMVADTSREGGGWGVGPVFAVHLSLEEWAWSWLAASVVSRREVMVKVENRFVKSKVTGELRLRPASSPTANWCSKRSSSVSGPQWANVSRCTERGSSLRSPENCVRGATLRHRLPAAFGGP